MRYLLLFTLLLLHLNAAAAPVSPPIPEPLQPWVPWVLANEPQRLCPFLYNSSSAMKGEQQVCAWPTQLNLDLTATGGQFSQQWRLYSETWVPLPGDSQHWPQDVTVNGQPQPVGLKQGRPSIKLKAGLQLIRGQWQWSSLPKSLRLPAATALLALTVNEQPRVNHAIDAEGMLWLASSMPDLATMPQPSDALTLQVFRKISDLNPLQVTNQIVLEVTGEQRELVLGPVLLDKQIPLQLDSPLPAKIEPDGRLRIQVRPGRWTINLVSRQHGNVQELSLPKIDAPWPEQEIWVFAAAPQLRFVEVENLTSLDPQQTNLPPDWQRLPAYGISQGQRMVLREIRRGNPDPPANQLELKRELWLDFDGGGYSIQDRLSGQINQGWRLEAQAELELGQVTLNGEPQFITQLPIADSTGEASTTEPVTEHIATEPLATEPLATEQPASGRKGIEIRQGRVSLIADSRYQGDISRIPAVGWNTDLAALETRLYLPPGWRLFSASGMDKAPNTWLSNWSLLDLFLVLIAALAALRLWGWSWGLITLVTLALIWHEHSGFGPPRWVWLNLLAASALLKVLSAGLLRKMLIGYRNVCCLVLLLIALPFMAEQVRLAMYPQLTEVRYYPPHGSVAAEAFDSRDEAQLYEVSAGQSAQAQSLADSDVPHPSAAPMPSKAQALHQADPNAKLQTGPGLPQWHANSITMSWNGPVAQSQEIKLILLSPTMNLFLSLLRVLLISLLMLRMAGINISRKRGFYQEQPLWSVMLPMGLILPLITVLSLVVSLALPTPAAAMPNQAIPDQTMLDELKSRLLAPPDCQPTCAQIANLQLRLPEATNTAEQATPQPLSMMLEIHSQADVAVPLPSARAHWQPTQVWLDGKPASALRRDSTGVWYLALSAGIHQVQLQGDLYGEQLQLDLPLIPHLVTLMANGWTVQGVDENGVANSQLQISRTPQPSAATSQNGPLVSGPLPDLVQVTRTLQLGLDWQVETHVSRVSPLGQAITLSVPLLTGESLLTDGLTVKDGKLQLTLSADQSSASWQSRLDKTSKLTLTAADTTRWSEVWRLDSSALWHITSSGLVVSQELSEQDNWLAVWYPWPGESLTLNISRPQGVPGQTLTIDSSQLNIATGRKAMEVELTLQVRSSQGGQHSVQLPAQSELQSVFIDGQSPALRLQDDHSLLLPLTPGAQQIQISWRQQPGITTAFSTPIINLNSASVNHDLALTLGEDRWILWTSGPSMGPAVLFWSLLLLIVLLALGLSRVRFTPLRFHHWLLLGVGLSQLPLSMALVVVAWLLALGLRGRWQQPARLFNLAQLGLALLSLVALGLLFLAVQQGLLGLPNMQISGHGSYGNTLLWYQDRSTALLPQAWVLSVPLWVYRLLMLSWALWLAFALLGWLRWGWSCFAYQGLWRPIRWRSKAPKTAPITPQATANKPADL